MIVKITPPSVRLVKPFALFFVIFGLSKIILLGVPSATMYRTMILNAGIFLGSTASLVYALTSLRYMYEQGGLDRFFYFVIAAIFIVVAIVVVLGVWY
jgi:hypothetical protein